MDQERLIKGARAAALAQLTRGFAHQTKNDLFASVGLAGILLEMSDDDFFRQRLQMIHESGEQLQRRAAAISNFARQQPKPAAETSNLAEAVREAVALIRQTALGADVEIEEEYTAADTTFAGSHNDIVSAVVLLLLNAEQSIPRGGKIYVKVERCNDNCLHAFIEDTGQGIRPEDMPHIFEPFFSTRPAQLGLGLTIVRAIVEAMSGTISADSTETGSDFCLTLPAAEASAD